MPQKSTDPQSANVPWTAVFCILSCFLIALLWWPVAKIPSHANETNFDGFNLHYQEQIARGQKLYDHPPKWEWENYPPLSFHIVAILGRIINDINTAGRMLCLLAYLAIAVLAAVIVQRLTQSRQIAIWTALAWLVWLAAFDVSHVPVNDPHLLGMAFGLAGVYCVLREPESPNWLAASAVFFVLSLFTKHSLVSLPAATAVYLFLTSKKRLGIWLGAAVLAGAVAAALTVLIDGPYVLQHMAPPRAYYPWGIAENTSRYIAFVAVGFVVALVWAIRNFSTGPATLLILAFGIALPVSMVYAGGAGSNMNHYYEPMLVTLLLIALGLPELIRLASRGPSPRMQTALLLIVPFFLSTILVLPVRISSDVNAYERRARTQVEFQHVVDIIRQQPGPAMCENTPLCSAAGKPREYDPFHADQLIRTGKAQPEELAALIASRHFGAIEMEWHSNEPMDARPRLHFESHMMRALVDAYQIRTRTDQYAVFVPR
jgi:hypothetical protein